MSTVTGYASDGNEAAKAANEVSPAQQLKICQLKIRDLTHDLEDRLKLLESKLFSGISPEIEECGIVVGIYKKDPSSRLGINSFSIPGILCVKET